MKFCDTCENMLYSIEERDGGAFYTCVTPDCKYEEKITNKTPIVYEHNLRQDMSIQYSMNPYLKLDPTLPRFTTMVCPNKACHVKTPDVVGVKLDATNVVWMYQCAHCDTTWKQGGVTKS